MCCRLLIEALKQFMALHGGKPPLPGFVPDMTSTSEFFIRLQGVISPLFACTLWIDCMALT